MNALQRVIREPSHVVTATKIVELNVPKEILLYNIHRTK